MTVVWRQWIEGFDSETEEAGCTVTIDSAASGRDKNTVTATIASASDTADRAVANVETAAWLPPGDEGRIRYWMRGTTGFNSRSANSTHCYIENVDPIQIIDVFHDVDEFLGVFSAANTLRSTSIPAVDLGSAWLQDEWHAVEIAWRGATDATGIRNVWLDGSLVEGLTGLDMVAAGDATPIRVRLGIDHYDGAAGTGWTAEVKWAQLSDDADEQLVDPVDVTPGRIYKRLVGPEQLAAAAADLYTVPDEARAVIRRILATNPSGAQRALTLSVGADAAGTRIFDAKPLAAGERLRDRGEHRLVAGETIQGYADLANVVVVVIDGYEESL